MSKTAYDTAMIVIGGLSNTSKMPWYSWSTSAYECNVGSKLRTIPGSTCSTCYALKGMYTFPNVKLAHGRRREALSHPDFVESFILVLTTLHLRGRRTYMLDGVLTKENRFRWFDSGDLDSHATIDKIVAIANATPFIDHWLPTREMALVKSWLNKNGPFPANLTVRFSAPMMGERFKSQPYGIAFSTVDAEDMDGINQCPAPTQDNKCGDCRTCWNKQENVNYASH